MPTGQTPEPVFEGLPYGQNAQVNQAANMIADTPYDPNEDFQAASPEDEFLFAPTDRPDEPITFGAPFGPGPSFPRAAFPNQADVFRDQVAQVAMAPEADAEVKAFAAKVSRGL